MVENIVRKGEIACHNVFHSYICLTCQNAAMCGNGLTGKKTWLEKEKMLVTTKVAQ